MGKLNQTSAIILLAVIGGALLVALLIFGNLGSSSTIKASLSKGVVLVGEEFSYRDSTRGASSWFWEFGNERTSERQNGIYAYTQAGNYKIRLTVNGSQEKLFSITVQERSEQAARSNLAQIEAPENAMQGELIVFRGIGNDQQWKWSFGETGVVDAREKEAIYAYAQAGIYEVTLFTENMQYPVSHLIEIYPQYSEKDTTDVMSVVGADIKEKLQNIADRKSFNHNFTYIIHTYLGGNQRTEVLINNSKYNDIYSYCQGLRMAGEGSVRIEQVVVDFSNPETKKVSKIMVIQSER